MTMEKRAREERRDERQREKERRRREKRNAPRAAPQITTAAEIIGRNVRTVEEVMLSLERGPQMNRSAPPIPVRLFVGSLNSATTSAKLRAHFEAYGDIAEASVVVDRSTGASRNFGFVTMADRKDGPAAIRALHRSELDGNQIVVNVANDRT